MRYFEDFEPGREMVTGGYLVTREEIIAFANKWDPQPFHTDEEAARTSVFGGLVACSCHTISIAILLANSETVRARVIAGLGWDELRLLIPVRPGDRLSLTVECLEKRLSQRKPDRGIARNLLTLCNQKGDPVLTFKDTIIVAKREA